MKSQNQSESGAAFLLRSKAQYARELGELDAQVFKRYKTTESQVSYALDYWRTEPRVRSASAWPLSRCIIASCDASDD